MPFSQNIQLGTNGQLYKDMAKSKRFHFLVWLINVYCFLTK